jgi:hypothetical protein
VASSQLRAALHGLPLASQAPPSPRMTLTDMGARLEGLGGLGDWTASVVGCDLLHKSLRRNKQALLKRGVTTTETVRRPRLPLRLPATEHRVRVHSALTPVTAK